MAGKGVVHLVGRGQVRVDADDLEIPCFLRLLGQRQRVLGQDTQTAHPRVHFEMHREPPAPGFGGRGL